MGAKFSFSKPTLRNTSGSVLFLLWKLVGVLVLFSVTGNYSYASNDSANDSEIEHYASFYTTESTDNENTEEGSLPVPADPNYANLIETQHMWNVVIGSDAAYGFEFMCGGTIIDSSTVVSSASCLIDQDPTKVRDGNNQLYRIQSVIFHPNFTAGSYYNDIALVKLGQLLKLNKTLVPTVRDTSFDSVDADMTHMAVVTDWDYVLLWPTVLKPKSPVIPRIIPESKNHFELVPSIKVASIIRDNKVCQKSYERYFASKSLGFDQHFPKRMDSTLICAILKEDDMFFEENTGFQLISTTSSIDASTPQFFLIGTKAPGPFKQSSQCDSTSLPAIYTNMSAFYGWISSHSSI